MVTAEELRDRIDKFNQKAEELLLQEEHDSARPYLEHVKNLQKRLDDLTGGDVLRLDVRSADAVVHLVCLQWSVSAKVIYSCWAVWCCGFKGDYAIHVFGSTQAIHFVVPVLQVVFRMNSARCCSQRRL